jgi:hypothetical protein
MMLNGALDQGAVPASGAEPVSATLALDARALHTALQRLKSAPTLRVLRRSVAELCRAVDGELRAGEAPALAIERDYLLSDLEQIAAARTIERAQYYVERLIKAISGVRTSAINDINLRRWKEYTEINTDSLWIIERRDRSGVHTAGYWGNFVPQIPRQLMMRYTKQGDWVIDPFAGLGTTLIEGQRLGRNTIGVELQEDVAEQARGLIAAEPNPHSVTSEVFSADSTQADYRALLEAHGQRSAQLVIMHPPYFDIIKFSDDPRDLSNAESIDTFLEMIGRVVGNVAPLLDRGRHLALVIGDKYARGDWIPLGFQTMNEVMRHGFALKSIIVKNFEQTAGKRAQQELWRYRALVGGFYIFKHEYIFLFRKQ